MKLSEFLAQIGHSGAVAAREAAEYSRHRLLGHFENGKPKTKKLKIGDTEVDVPTFVLSRSGGLDLHELHVEIETNISIDEAQGITDTPQCKIDVGLKKGLFSRSTHAKVRAIFQMGPPPEALSQIEDKLNQALMEELRNKEN